MASQGEYGDGGTLIMGVIGAIPQVATIMVLKSVFSLSNFWAIPLAIGVNVAGTLILPFLLPRNESLVKLVGGVWGTGWGITLLYASGLTIGEVLRRVFF